MCTVVGYELNFTDMGKAINICTLGLVGYHDMRACTCLYNNSTRSCYPPVRNMGGSKKSADKERKRRRDSSSGSEDDGEYWADKSTGL